MFVSTRMAGNPFTVTPETTVPEAGQIMAAKNVRHLPVVDDGKLVGVISATDVAAAGPSKATTLSAHEANYLMNKLKVRSVMTKNPITVEPDTLLEQAATLMRDNKVEMLPVLSDGKLVGVITESNIMDAFIDLLGFRDRGTRLTMDAHDVPGQIEKLGRITAQHSANINHLAVYHGGVGGRSTIVVGINSTNTEQIEHEFESAGFVIVARLVN